MSGAPQLDDLRGYGLEQLERLFASETRWHVALPRGRFDGVFLRRLGSCGARRLWARAVESIGFELLPFGIDFERAAWFFAHPRLQAGRFVADVGPSRWRQTEVVRLRYSPSRLPFRGLLYDEIKPLDEQLWLGLAGINAPRGEGDHFFFALVGPNGG